MNRKILAALLGTTALCAIAAAALGASTTNAPPPAQPVYNVWSNLTSNGVTPVTTAGANASSLVVKAGPGNLYSVYATNASATAGKLIVINATAAPSYGAYTTVLDCVTLPASGTASISSLPGPGTAYSAGVTALISSNASCYIFDQTTAVITGFIKGIAP